MTYAIQSTYRPTILAITGSARAARSVAMRMSGAVVRCFDADRRPVGEVHYRYGRRVAVYRPGPADIERLYQARLEAAHGLVYL